MMTTGALLQFLTAERRLVRGVTVLTRFCEGSHDRTYPSLSSNYVFFLYTLAFFPPNFALASDVLSQGRINFFLRGGNGSEGVVGVTWVSHL